MTDRPDAPGPAGPPWPPDTTRWMPPPPVGGGPPAGPPPSWSPPSAPGPPPAAPSGDSAGSGRRRLRILGRALVVLAVIAALAGTTAWGLSNRSSAERWRDRSRAADVDLETSIARLESTTVALDDARQRLRDLAAEKAGETDQNRILSEIVAAAPDVTAAMRDCQVETTDLARDVLAELGNPAVDLVALQDRIDEVNETCIDALDAASELEATIDELGF